MQRLARRLARAAVGLVGDQHLRRRRRASRARSPWPCRRGCGVNSATVGSGAWPGALEPHLVDAAGRRRGQAARRPASRSSSPTSSSRVGARRRRRRPARVTVRGVAGAEPRRADADRRRRRRAARRRAAAARAAGAPAGDGSRRRGAARGRAVGLGPGGGEQRRLALDLGHDPRLQRRRRRDRLDRRGQRVARPARSSSTSSRQAGAAGEVRLEGRALVVGQRAEQVGGDGVGPAVVVGSGGCISASPPLRRAGRASSSGRAACGP